MRLNFKYRIIYFFLFCFYLWPGYSIDSILILNFENHTDKREYNYYQDVIIESLRNHLNYIPETIDKIYFETELLKIIKDKEKQNLLQKYYHLEGEVYRLTPPEQKEEDEKNLWDLFKQLDYNKSYLLFDQDDIAPGITNLEKIRKIALRKSVDYLITGYYLVYDKQIKIVFRVYDLFLNKIHYIKEIKGDSEQDIFDLVRQGVKELFKQMSEKAAADFVKNNQKSIIEEQAKEIAELRREFLVVFKLGALYNGIISNIRDLNIENNYDLNAPFNLVSHSATPFFFFFYYRSVNQHYFGFGLDFSTPIFFSMPRYNSFTRINLMFTFGFRQRYIFKWGIEMMMNLYQKYAQDKSEAINIFLFYAGINFAFQYMPKGFPFYLEGGFSVFPPVIPYKEGYGDGDGGDGPLPFLVNIEGSMFRESYLFPVSPKIGAAYFFTSDVGIFIDYAMYYTRISYKLYKKNKATGAGDKIYLGKEIAIYNRLTIGIVYRNIIR
ncbi:MAG: hypothetical protein MJB14_02040 [Spirochaetes bacterium]|nr:hypothetical protein [Spirochaetota bacterium]